MVLGATKMACYNEIKDALKQTPVGALLALPLPAVLIISCLLSTVIIFLLLLRPGPLACAPPTILVGEASPLTVTSAGSIRR